MKKIESRGLLTTYEIPTNIGTRSTIYLFLPLRCKFFFNTREFASVLLFITFALSQVFTFYRFHNIVIKCLYDLLQGITNCLIVL